MNKFIFLGNLTKEVEAKQSGELVIANFNIAVQRRFKNANGEYESDFFRITAFGKTAEFITKYFNKGSKMLVEGHIQNRTYENEAGEKKYITDFIAENVFFGGSRKTVEEKAEEGFITIDDTDELPF